MTRSRTLLCSAAAGLALAGLACLFAPAEVLRALVHDPGDAAAPLIQLLGAALLALALLDWMLRSMALGGIYGRPVLMANLMAFGTGSLVLLKAVRVDSGPALWCAAGAYTLFAAGAGILLLARPGSHDGA